MAFIYGLTNVTVFDHVESSVVELHQSYAAPAPGEKFWRASGGSSS
jgi:hypothetical protein